MYVVNISFSHDSKFMGLGLIVAELNPEPQRKRLQTCFQNRWIIKNVNVIVHYFFQLYLYQFESEEVRRKNSPNPCGNGKI
jgi:hypothetical protein